MKKGSKVLFPLVILAFIGIRLTPVLLSKKQEPIQVSKPSLTLPKPVAVRDSAPLQNLLTQFPIQIESPAAKEHFKALLNHPWIQQQQGLKHISPEMVRDIELLQCWHKALTKNALQSGRVPLSEKQITRFFIETLSALQKKIPFHFPDHYYNVLNIAETRRQDYPTPIGFQVHKRLYLDETELGLPFYLDVRVFDLGVSDQTLVKQVIDWHFDLLDRGKRGFEAIGSNAYLGKGVLCGSSNDLTHGFAALQGERGVFVQFATIDNCLYVVYASAPWNTFSKHLPLFQELSLQDPKHH